MFCHNLRLPQSQFSAPHPILPCHCQARHRSVSSPRPQNTQTGARGDGAECSPSRFMCSTLWPRPITNLDAERRRRFAGGVEIEEQTSLMFEQVAFGVHHFLFLSHRRHPQLTPASSCACAALSYEPARWKHLWPVRTCRAECGGCSYFLFCIRLYWFFFYGWVLNLKFCLHQRHRASRLQCWSRINLYNLIRQIIYGLNARNEDLILSLHLCLWLLWAPF